jgi:hypothetical protein
VFAAAFVVVIIAGMGEQDFMVMHWIMGHGLEVVVK